MKKIVGILFGGKTAEHDVSLMSAKSVVENIDRDLFEIKIYGLDRENTPHKFTQDQMFSVEDDIFKGAERISWSSFSESLIDEVDVVFPILHGPYGEDGKLQGFFEMLGKKYVGCGLSSSAVCMDKTFCKLVLLSENFKMLPFMSLRFHEYKEAPKEFRKRIIDKLGFPIFVKPSNMGSSVGVTKAIDEETLISAIDLAFKYDEGIVLEKGIEARELECGVIGLDSLKATAVGEIVPSHEFYDYDAKYSEKAKSDLIIPAKIPAEEYEFLQKEAARACTVVKARGLSRVDFLKDKATGDVYLSEINTMPGFTKFSMYPLLAKETGYSYKDLITELINIGLS